jgi:predicted transcriptional regulator of viral defense system
MDNEDTVRKWIGNLLKNGKTTFTQEEVFSQFPNHSTNSIRASLYRLAKKNAIRSVWRGFFVVVAYEYGMRGLVPPVDYIDPLMRHLGKRYYVGLLSAAALHGAAHQQPQVFQVVVEGASLRDKNLGTSKIAFSFVKKIPETLVGQIVGRTGNIPISSPELTAVDLISRHQSVGGLDRVATVLEELSEKFELEKNGQRLISCTKKAVIQRLGYLLDMVLQKERESSLLHQLASDLGIVFIKCNLDPSLPNDNCPMNEKWKVIVNYDVEADEW